MCVQYCLVCPLFHFDLFNGAVTGKSKGLQTDCITYNVYFIYEESIRNLIFYVGNCEYLDHVSLCICVNSIRHYMLLYAVQLLRKERALKGFKTFKYLFALSCIRHGCLLVSYEMFLSDV